MTFSCLNFHYTERTNVTQFRNCVSVIKEV